MIMDPIDWIDFNLSSSMGRYDNRERQVIFAVTASNLWYNRNKYIFEGKISTTAGTLKQSWCIG